MSGALYKDGLRGSWRLFLILGAVLTLYFTVIVTMYDPELGSVLEGFSKAMPELMAAVGMGNTVATLADFMANYLYGFSMLVFPMLYSIFTANRLVAKPVDRGYMSYYLASPVSRVKIVTTQMVVLLTGIVLMVVYATVLGIGSCEVFFPGELDVGVFIQMNLGALALHLFISGVCFLCSCLFNDTKYSIGLGAGIPALSFVLQMLAGSGDKLKNFRYATFFTLFDPNGIIQGESSAYAGVAALAVGAVLLYGAAVAVFAKKDVPV